MLKISSNKAIEDVNREVPITSIYCKIFRLMKGSKYMFSPILPLKIDKLYL